MRTIEGFGFSTELFWGCLTMQEAKIAASRHMCLYRVGRNCSAASRMELIVLVASSRV